MASTAGCKTQPRLIDGAVRLRGGFGTPCDPLHTGFVEVYNEAAEQWGAICLDVRDVRPDYGAANVVCRQLGFAHGSIVDTRSPVVSPNNGNFQREYEEEAAEVDAQEIFWLDTVSCRGPETRILDCDVGRGYMFENKRCPDNPFRLTVACRQFSVPEALEDVTTPGAGVAITMSPCYMFLYWLNENRKACS